MNEHSRGFVYRMYRTPSFRARLSHLLTFRAQYQYSTQRRADCDMSHCSANNMACYNVADSIIEFLQPPPTETDDPPVFSVTMSYYSWTGSAVEPQSSIYTYATVEHLHDFATYKALLEAPICHGKAIQIGKGVLLDLAMILATRCHRLIAVSCHRSACDFVCVN